MASPLTPSASAVISLALLVLLSHPFPSLAVPTPFLSVPSSVFSATVKTAIGQVGQILSLLSQYANLFGDARLSNAVDDCVDLLDLSSDELTWSLADADSVSSNGKRSGTGYHGSDVRAWLSAALGNQDTCLDGFDGTDGIVKAIVAGSLEQLTGTIADVLGMVRQVPSSDYSGGFPSWVKPGDWRLLQAPLSRITPDVTVAADGSGDFTSVKDAVLAAPDYSEGRYVIYIKKGVYNENVEVKKKKWNLMMVGDGMDVTVISSNRNFIDGWTTFRSATFAVSGRGFIARDITFENTAGPQKHQAVALRSDSDLSAYYRCGIHGYQDTLYAHSLRQFYRECYITGTVDFIFGNGAIVFQNCLVMARYPLPNQKNTITAQGRKDPNQNTGFSFQYCNITATADLLSSKISSTLPTYLGRPWKQYSRTVFMQSYLSSVVRPEGWLEWRGDFALDTLFYGEYKNFGPGSGLKGRVKWPGFHVITDPKQANNFTAAQFIDGDLWLPATGVKYTSGLGA